MLTAEALDRGRHVVIQGHGRPYADVIPGARGALLAVLVQIETPITVRGLARYAVVSPLLRSTT